MQDGNSFAPDEGLETCANAAGFTSMSTSIEFGGRAGLEATRSILSTLSESALLENRRMEVIYRLSTPPPHRKLLAQSCSYLITPVAPRAYACCVEHTHPDGIHPLVPCCDPPHTNQHAPGVHTQTARGDDTAKRRAHLNPECELLYCCEQIEDRLWRTRKSTGRL